MNFFKNLKKSDKISIISLFIVFIFSIWSRIDSCNQNKKIEDLEYKNSALQYRPNLVVVGTPILDSAVVDNPIKLNSRYSDSTYNIEIPQKYFITLKLFNSGNSIAKFIGYIFTDTTSGEDIIRKYILNNNWGQKDIEVTNKIYYSSKEIKSNDTISISFNPTVQFVEDERFTLHFLFLYYGENGVLYDTYYWVRCSASPLKIRIDSIIVKGKFFKMVSQKFAKHDLLKIIDYNSSWNIYDKEDSRNILEFIFKKK